MLWCRLCSFKFHVLVWLTPEWWWGCGVCGVICVLWGESVARTNLSLFSLSQQREKQYKAAEMGHRFPGSAGRRLHWALVLMELLQAVNALPKMAPPPPKKSLIPKHKSKIGKPSVSHHYTFVGTMGKQSFQNKFKFNSFNKLYLDIFCVPNHLSHEAFPPPCIQMTQ